MRTTINRGTVGSRWRSSHGRRPAEIVSKRARAPRRSRGTPANGSAKASASRRRGPGSAGACRPRRRRCRPAGRPPSSPWPGGSAAPGDAGGRRRGRSCAGRRSARRPHQSQGPRTVAAQLVERRRRAIGGEAVEPWSAPSTGRARRTDDIASAVRSRGMSPVLPATRDLKRASRANCSAPGSIPRRYRRVASSPMYPARTPTRTVQATHIMAGTGAVTTFAERRRGQSPGPAPAGRRRASWR